MRTKFLQLWDNLQSSYWFVPSIMTLLALGLSAIFIRIDQSHSFKYSWAKETIFVWAGGPEGAREVLSTISGSMITVAGVVFSITIVALTLASSQFGPRLLRNFMSDRGNQIVLGTFISTYIYCLLILRTVQGMDNHEFVPYLSVSFGLLLAIVSLGVLIYFIHHVADSIQAENLIATVGRELVENIERLFPEEFGSDRKDVDVPSNVAAFIPANLKEISYAVTSKESGYIQSINNEKLMKLAKQYSVKFSLSHKPGDFVYADSSLLDMWPKQKFNEELEQECRDSFFIAGHRTATQDAEYSLNQLVEVALRALSPSVNDPFTANTCIEWIGSGLNHLASRKIPSKYRFDDEGEFRLIAESSDFEHMANVSLDPIRQYAKTSPMVVIKLLQTIQMLAPRLVRQQDRQTLLNHAHKLLEDSRDSLDNVQDKQHIYKCYRKAVEMLEQGQQTE